MDQKKSTRPLGMRTVMELFDVSPQVAITVLTISFLILAGAAIYFVRSAPPTTITMSTGPEGSVYYKHGQKYARILARDGVKVKLLPSEGSLQNLQRLADPKSGVDIGLVQSGVSAVPTENLVSLGSISYQPFLIFYRGKPIELLSELAGKKIAVGPEGSGVRSIALTLLKANNIEEGGSSTLLNWEATAGAKAVLDKKIDAVFVMSESASMDLLHDLLHADNVHLFSFKQANAYSRKMDYLNVLELPEGSIDLAFDIPRHDITLLGPSVELIAKGNLHPALSDLLLAAATEIHGKPGLFQKRGEFPILVEHTIPVSDDATRFYKSGKSFLYKYLPFWLASLTSRAIVVFFPLLVVMIPAIRTVPSFFRWRMQIKIRRRYRELLDLERDFVVETELKEKEHLRRRFDRIEDGVNKMKVPAKFADQFYALRGHIDYVRLLVARRSG